MAKDEFLRVRISKETKDELQKLCAKDHRTLSDYIRLVLIRHVEEKTKKP